MSRELREEIERIGAELAREREEGSVLRTANTELLVRLQAVEQERDRWKLRAKTLRETVDRERKQHAVPPPPNAPSLIPPVRGSGGGGRAGPQRPRPPPTSVPSSGARILL